MALSAEVFEEVTKCVKRDSSGNKEKRNTGRVGLRCPIEITLLEGTERVGRPVAVHMRDISPEGIGLTCGSAMSPRALFTVQLRGEEGKALAVQYEVTRCRCLSQRSYQVGAKLVYVSDESEGEMRMAGSGWRR